MKIVDENKLLPNKFEPLRVNRWVMMLEGVDAYLVKTVEPPVIESNSSTKILVLGLFNVASGDQNERLKAWLDAPLSKDGELKFLDPVGTVVELWKFRVRPQKMWFDKLDYNSSGLLTTYLQIETETFEIVSTRVKV